MFLRTCKKPVFYIDLFSLEHCALIVGYLVLQQVSCFVSHYVWAKFSQLFSWHVWPGFVYKIIWIMLKKLVNWAQFFDILDKIKKWRSITSKGTTTKAKYRSERGDFRKGSQRRGKMFYTFAIRLESRKDPALLLASSPGEDVFSPGPGALSVAYGTFFWS